MDFPQTPNTHALVMLLMTGVALFLFTREKIHLESSSLAILVMVVIGFELFPFVGPRGVIEPTTFFYGFGHEALIAVCALMIAGEALVSDRCTGPGCKTAGQAVAMESKVCTAADPHCWRGTQCFHE